MKRNVILATACLLAALWIGATVLSAGDSPSKDSPGLQAAANGPKDSPPGWERVVFIHYRKGYGKPDESPGKKPPSSGPSCYGFIARGAEWQTLPVSFNVAWSNQDGLSRRFVKSAFSAAAAEWDNWTTATLFSDPNVVDSLTVNTDATDGHNNIVFADLSASHAIAITYVWGRFGGPVEQRRIVEFDMILDDTEYKWGDAGGTGGSSLMDVQNIATHELGHALGLNDIYQSTCSAVTMYGYSDYGETAKRSLEAADITGLRELYGE